MVAQNGTVYRDIPRIDSDLLALLRGASVADIHDALPPAARAAGLLNPALRPITSGSSVCGQAVTAFCAPGDSMMSHCALYLAAAGDVVVVSNGGVATGAMWGGNMAFDAKTAKIAGAVVDAPVRDVALIRELAFPMWASAVSVSRSEKVGFGCVNMPIPCGGGMVNPGDIVVADDDGVLVFAPDHIKTIADKNRKRRRDEAAIQKDIKAGRRLFETQRFGELLEKSGIRIHDGPWTPKSGHF